MEKRPIDFPDSVRPARKGPPKRFLQVFTPGYWRLAAREYTRLRTLCIAALMAALIVAVELLFIPVGENLRIMFSFLPAALGGAIYGPLVAVGVGFVSDIIGGALFPSGPFFFGYTLTAMAGGLLYGLLLYRSRITVLRLAVCKLCVNLLVNVLLGSVWSAMLMGNAYVYYLAKSIVKNTILLPVEIVMLTLLFGALMPMLKKYGVTLQKNKRFIDLW